MADETTPFTAEQWEALNAARDRFLADRISTEPLDEDVITAAVKEVYRWAELPAPAVIWFDGPATALLAKDLLRGTSLTGEIGRRVGDVAARVIDDLELGYDQRQNLRTLQADGAILEPSIERLHRALAGRNPTNQTPRSWDDVLHDVADRLGVDLKAALMGNPLTYATDDGTWKTYLRNMDGAPFIGACTPDDREAMAVSRAMAATFMPGFEQLTPKITDMLNTAFAVQQPMPWWPLCGVAIMCRKHTSLTLDERYRLHNETGPAWEWADGTRLGFLEGVNIPGWVIREPDPAKFLKYLRNDEQRRVAFAAYGWQRAADELGWTVINDSGDPYTGVLYELPDKLLTDSNGRSLNLLVGRNASPHPGGNWAVYGMPVQRRYRKAESAQASRWGLKVSEWKMIGART